MATLIKKHRRNVKMAQLISNVLSPCLIPTLAFLALFFFSYLRIMPVRYKLIVIGMVFCFTAMLPMVAACLARYFYPGSERVKQARKRRIVTYIFTIIAYASCLLLMYQLNIPWYMMGIVFTYLLTLLLMLITNLKWNLSEHTAGTGMLIGGLVSFAALFLYNPVWWLCLLILVAGALASARIMMGNNSLREVMGGFVIGLLSALMVLHPSSNFFFRFLF